jgi:hypothetical protein
MELLWIGLFVMLAAGIGGLVVACGRVVGDAVGDDAATERAAS